MDAKVGRRVSWLPFICAQQQRQALKPLIRLHFLQKRVPRISRTGQPIPQVLRDTLRYTLRKPCIPTLVR